MGMLIIFLEGDGDLLPDFDFNTIFGGGFKAPLFNSSLAGFVKSEGAFNAANHGYLDHVTTFVDQSIDQYCTRYLHVASCSRVFGENAF